METLVLLAQSDAGRALVGGGVLFLVIALIASVVWIWALIDCLTSGMPTNEKVLWVLVIFFLHLLGAILYFAIGRKGRHRTTT